MLKYCLHVLLQWSNFNYFAYHLFKRESALAQFLLTWFLPLYSKSIIFIHDKRTLGNFTVSLVLHKYFNRTKTHFQRGSEAVNGRCVDY